MTYAQENLMPNERIIFLGRIHPAIFLPSLTVLALTIILFASVWIPSSPETGSGLMLCFALILTISTVVLGLQAFIIKATTELAVTNQKIIAKTGLLRRRTLELLLQKVESVGVSRISAGV